MKIVTLQENLKSSLLQLQKAVPSKPQLPILSSVLFSASETEVALSATDLYLGIRTTIAATVEEPGVIAVPAEIFKQLITSLPAGKITLHTTDKALIITTEHTKAQIPYQNSEEFPQFPDVGGTQVEFSETELDVVVTQTGYAFSNDTSRPVYTSLLFSFEADKLTVVGTDGFRLAILTLDGKQNLQDQKILLPAKAVQEVHRITTQLKLKAVVGQFDIELKQAKFILDTTEMYVRMIEGEFPPYERILPTEFMYEVEIDRESLLAELKRAQFFARETSNIVRFSLESDLLKIMARSPSYGEYHGEVEVKNAQKEKLDIAFNGSYIVDFLSAQSDQVVIFLANESLKPALFQPESQRNFRYVVMPFRVSE